jgi:hypothetical protein
VCVCVCLFVCLLLLLLLLFITLIVRANGVLVQLSPKKTWEGFIGGGIACIAWSFFVAGFLGQYEHFVCSAATLNIDGTCTPGVVFQPAEYFLPGGYSVTLLPVQLHSVAFGVFASLIAPFGGFFASGGTWLGGKHSEAHRGRVCCGGVQFSCCVCKCVSFFSTGAHPLPRSF